jgi:hypothetical protein
LDIETIVQTKLFCHPEVKVKLLFEINKLRSELCKNKMRMSVTAKGFPPKGVSKIPENFLEDGLYLERVGQINKEIKNTEDKLRKVFLSDVPQNTGNELLINVFAEVDSAPLRFLTTSFLRSV